MEFDKWVEKGTAPALGSSLKLYQEVLKLGFKVFLLTGRSERHRSVTVENLMNAGFHDWHKLILRWVNEYGFMNKVCWFHSWCYRDKSGKHIWNNQNEICLKSKCMLWVCCSLTCMYIYLLQNHTSFSSCLCFSMCFSNHNVISHWWTLASRSK